MESSGINKILLCWTSLYRLFRGLFILLLTSNARRQTRLTLSPRDSAPGISLNQLFAAVGNLVFAGKYYLIHQRFSPHVL